VLSTILGMGVARLKIAVYLFLCGVTSAEFSTSSRHRPAFMASAASLLSVVRKRPNEQIGTDIHHCRGAAIRNHVAVPSFSIVIPDLHGEAGSHPEPKFFLHRRSLLAWIQYYFDTWFAEAGAYPAAGEKTTNYLESAIRQAGFTRISPGAARVHPARACTPRIFELDVVAMNGMGPRNFETALAREEARERQSSHGSGTRARTPISRGAVLGVLAPVFRLVSREQLLCVKIRRYHPASPGLASASTSSWAAGASRDAEGLSVVKTRPKARRDNAGPRARTDCASATRRRIVSLRICSDPNSRAGKIYERRRWPPCRRAGADTGLQRVGRPVGVTRTRYDGRCFSAPTASSGPAHRGRKLGRQLAPDLQIASRDARFRASGSRATTDRTSH